MLTSPKSKLVVALFAFVALLVLPAAANATLTYTKGFNKPRVFIAEDDGGDARSIGLGTNSHISPDGEWVVYERATGTRSELRLYSVPVGKSERVLGNWAEPFIFGWSPDSSTFAALSGPLNGPKTLLAIDAESGARTKLARGYFSGVSFSPESTGVVYAAAKVESFPAKSDVYRAAVAGGTPVALTSTHDAIDPLWGPSGRIVFARELAARKRRYGPKNELFTMDEDGKRVRRLTTTSVSPLAQGLVPTAWSADGSRLLSEFGGEDESYAVAVDAYTGAEKPLTKNPETGFQGAALSADGTTVLGTAGLGFGPSKPRVVTVPFAGGPQKVLVVDGYDPSWSG